MTDDTHVERPDGPDPNPVEWRDAPARDRLADCVCDDEGMHVMGMCPVHPPEEGHR